MCRCAPSQLCLCVSHACALPAVVPFTSFPMAVASFMAWFQLTSDQFNRTLLSYSEPSTPGLAMYVHWHAITSHRCSTYPGRGSCSSVPFERPNEQNTLLQRGWPRAHPLPSRVPITRACHVLRPHHTPYPQHGAPLPSRAPRTDSSMPAACWRSGWG